MKYLIDLFPRSINKFHFPAQTHASVGAGFSAIRDVYTPTSAGNDNADDNNNNNNDDDNNNDDNNNENPPSSR